jgi:hypothetical protein
VGKQKIQRIPLLGGGEAMGYEVEFEPIKEPWCEYQLAGGGTIRCRATVVKVWRVVDASGKPGYLPDGQPNVVTSQNIQIMASE